MDGVIPVEKVADLFAFDGTVRDIKPFGCGHINDTFCVYCEREDKPPIRYILQRINHRVFKNFSQLMENVFNVTEYLRGAVIAEGGDPQQGMPADYLHQKGRNGLRRFRRLLLAGVQLYRERHQLRDRQLSGAFLLFRLRVRQISAASGGLSV